MTDKKLLLVPFALSFVAAVSAGAGACSSSTTVTLTSSPPPNGVRFIGGSFGGNCEGDVYTTAGTGYAYCDDDKWAYTTDNPVTAGYMEYAGVPDGGPVADGDTVNDGDTTDGDIQGFDVHQGGDDGGQGGHGTDAGDDDGGQGDDSGDRGGDDDGGPQGH
jgi:hypothetical protein